MKERLQRPVKQWVKFGIWALIYILFIVWVGNFWWLFLLPLIFDIFITRFIPYDWWKKYKDTNPVIYTICSWIDAIVFALVAVYFIFLYLFQNYQIPSSSLEKRYVSPHTPNQRYNKVSDAVFLPCGVFPLQ